MHARYFSREEIFETLSKTKLGSKAILVTRTPMQELRMRKNNIKPKMSTYIYKNKAIYKGEWCGGFRHGFGRIEWSDSACYEGKWNCGYAHGDVGVFIDC